MTYFDLLTPTQRKALLNNKQKYLERITETFKQERESIIREIHELKLMIKKDGEQE